MSGRLALIRNSDVAPAKEGRGKHNTSDNSSGIAMKRAIHARVADRNRGNTLFGDFGGGAVANGTKVAGKQQNPNKGAQSTYLYFKSIFPSMSINTVSDKK
tara:strand:+ start:2141 stop:2443 length:303 start_codon:yes stop_codon:yes gene_type:complete